ncbi:MAG TPA: ribosome small subunit-dependent GTPase A [Thermomicrobiales bacterium]
MSKTRRSVPAIDTDMTEVDEDPFLEGLVVDGSRGIYRVETPEGALRCEIRGRLRKQLSYAQTSGTKFRNSVQRVKVHTHDPVAVGDRVRVLVTGHGTGMIEEIVTRGAGAFTRRDPDAGQGTLRSIVGLEQLVAVLAVREPEPHLGLLDRFLVTAESVGLRAVICMNKVDLGIPPQLDEQLAVYRAIGYPVVLTSTAAGSGIDALRGRLAGRISAFLGPSGVGKSSLLNALQPGLHERISAVSEATGKGRHTTTGTRLFPLGGSGGYIADTAGIRALTLHQETLDHLDTCFPEFRPYLGQCVLGDCSHLHEPRCAIRDAVEAGAIARARYASYRRLLRGEGDPAASAARNLPYLWWSGIADRAPRD